MVLQQNRVHLCPLLPQQRWGNVCQQLGQLRFPLFAETSSTLAPSGGLGVISEDSASRLAASLSMTLTSVASPTGH